MLCHSTRQGWAVGVPAHRPSVTRFVRLRVAPVPSPTDGNGTGSGVRRAARCRRGAHVPPRVRLPRAVGAAPRGRPARKRADGERRPRTLSRSAWARTSHVHAKVAVYSDGCTRVQPPPPPPAPRRVPTAHWVQNVSTLLLHPRRCGPDAQNPPTPPPTGRPRRPLLPPRGRRLQRRWAPQRRCRRHPRRRRRGRRRRPRGRRRSRRRRVHPRPSPTPC